MSMKLISTVVRSPIRGLHHGDLKLAAGNIMARPGTICMSKQYIPGYTRTLSSLPHYPATTSRWHVHAKSGYPVRMFIRSLFIQTTPTPNENAMKFSPQGEAVMKDGSSMEFYSIREASRSPLARTLLMLDGVKSVYFGPDFITVMKEPDFSWNTLKPEVFEAITTAYASGEPIYNDVPGGEAGAGATSLEGVITDTTILETDSDVVAMIKELMETRIKPAVAEDGGNIIFRGFDEESGVVSVELQGACSSCSSSSVTLKMGVQNMLMHYIPEVKEVVEVKGEAAQVAEAEFENLEKKLSDTGILRS